MAGNALNQDTIIGGLQGDTLIGDNGNDSLTGGDGNDLILGKGGNDTLSGGGGYDTIYGGQNKDVILGGDGIDSLYGGRGDDTIDGQKGNDFMSGGIGNDKLIWNNGDGSDILNGGTGYDTAVVNDDPVKGDDFVLGQKGNNAFFERVNFGQFSLDADNVEKFDINATGGDDRLTVNDLSNTDVKLVDFSGGAGNDTLDGSNTSTKITANGGAGNDELIGGSANDTLIGASGNDDIEGEKGDDTMIGGAGNDTLGWDDGDGSDRMSGNSGYDTIEVDGAVAKGDDFVLNQQGEKAIFDRVNLGKFTLTVDSSEKFDVSGLGGDDKFTVNDLSNTDVKLVEFSGGDGNDTLDGSNTSTTMTANGDAGNDLLQGGAANDKFYGGQGNDTLLGGGGVDTLNGGSGNDIIDGQKGNDVMNGDAGNDKLIWNNGDGSDILDGGTGYDTAVVNDDSVKGDSFVLGQQGDNAFFERVNFGNFSLDADNIEKFDINGTGGDESLKVNNLDNTDVKLVDFSGGEGNDLLDASGTNTPIFADGGAGNDTLTGGNGNDTLIGGEGSDLIEGNGGNDVLIGGQGGDIYSFNPASAGMNTIQGFVSGTDKIALDLPAFDANNFAVVNDDATAASSEAMITYSLGTGALFYNQNGAEAGYGDGGQFAMLEGVNNLSYNDFITKQA